MKLNEIRSSELTVIYSPQEVNNTIPKNWYVSKFEKIPNMYHPNGRIRVTDFIKEHEKNIIQYEMFNERKSNEKCGSSCTPASPGQDVLSDALIKLDDGTIAVLYSGFIDKSGVHVARLYAMFDKPTKALETFKDYCSKNRMEEEKKGVLNLLCKTCSGFELREFFVKDPGIDFECNYNEDFKDVSKIILERLNTKDDKGLVLLHSKPGMGKTSYIRHVINNVDDKRVIYMPPDLAGELSNPELIPFLSLVPNSIIIIEDAENVLMKRTGQQNQAISNILNLSDGLLSDCLNIQIMATFNTDLLNIDEALLRKGRLIAKYEFKELTIDRKKNLAKKLNIVFDKNNQTLAEMYNSSTPEFTKTSKKIGFKSKAEELV